MRKTTLIFLCLWLALLAKGQDITIDAPVTADNAIITFEQTVAEYVPIDRALLPLWYTTILQDEQKGLIIDSLRMAYEQASTSVKYFQLESLNREKQIREYQTIIKGLEQKNDLSTGELSDQLKKWKLIGKGSAGVAILIAIIAMIK